MSEGKRRVRVIALGGTIAMTAKDGHAGVTPSLDAQALIEAVPGLNELARIEAESFARVPGAHLTLLDLVRLARRIEQVIGDGVEGVVVTQGTDTIEESAMALDLLLATEQPVIVTGAMRDPARPGADGPANVRGAVLAAASDRARGMGVLVAMNDEIHAARFVRKAHTSRPSAFVSAGAGPVGWTAEDRVRIPLRLSRRVHIGLPPQTEEIAAVALVTAALGDDGRALGTLPGHGYQGVVVAGFGVGHVARRTVESLARLAREMPVVLASRTGAGETFTGTYGFPGSERDLLGNGLIPAGALAAPQARVLLALALSAGWSATSITAAYDALSG
ncbi:L-asparaginase [[Actinomadura] parvosata subsp. kistnae]|uniref:asparaginase n=1 Tax=[Actinomadura] parvosata TaxID=1955412 RepID=UPI000D26A8A5|nr:L-asparaginase [Actinomadura parvosata subsp. kistnae]